MQASIYGVSSKVLTIGSANIWLMKVDTATLRSSPQDPERRNSTIGTFCNADGSKNAAVAGDHSITLVKHSMDNVDHMEAFEAEHMLLQKNHRACSCQPTS